jgi:hypothetical protein
MEKTEEYRNVDISEDAQPRSKSRQDIEKWIEKRFSLDC